MTDNNSTTKLQCCICQHEYEIRSDSPMWASVWDFCPACQLEDDEHDKRLFKDGVWGCGESDCKFCY